MDYYAAREELVNFLRQDLEGPVFSNEIIKATSRMDNYYVVGKLYPKEVTVLQEDLERDLTEDGESVSEQSINLCYSSLPSSMAISFSVCKNPGKLLISLSYAFYISEEVGKDENDQILFDWRRNSHEVSIMADVDDMIEHRQKSIMQDLDNNMHSRLLLQRVYDDGTATFTCTLENRKKGSKDLTERSRIIAFQPFIKVRQTDGKSIFIEKKMTIPLNVDIEIRTLEMLYRKQKMFAIGHGCSAEWTNDGDHASEIRSVIIPEYDLQQMKPSGVSDPRIFEFDFLASATPKNLEAGLRELSKSYGIWIANLPSVDPKFASIREGNIVLCEESLARIENGIALLAKGGDEYMAFTLVNRAMLNIRIKNDPNADIHKQQWYPFQLAFILQEISSISSEEDKYRQIVDLLWFPTGGGKTEAYLGLSGFAIFLRRIRAVKIGQTGAGVTVLMRYTLRLLTLQQFVRATILICACELIRRENADLLGSSEIASGLWVGGGLTPNHTLHNSENNSAEDSLAIIKSNGSDNLGENMANPCQLKKCPWCNADLIPANYVIRSERMLIQCANPMCEFKSTHLPVYLIDDDIYSERPSLLLATVDKFARIAWEPKIGSLFGLDTPNRSPELIIQDELHLIAGPLGTISGLYEVVIDKLCEKNGIPPKIISSTATIRNASGQIKSLYGRDHRQFPQQGVFIDNSYFASESTREEKPSRLYLGVMSPGTSSNTTLIRVYSALLAGIRYLKCCGCSDDIIDSFWTLTGYFNSLRELGGAVIYVMDDIIGRFNFLVGSKFKHLYGDEEINIDIPKFDELTSRKDSAKIGDILNQLEIRYPDPRAYELILASSMLSVGVDVGRLGLMVVQGQPKTNSEYIQATSRIGRKNPGLVITLLNATRSRDISHYEQFNGFHNSLYKYVEAASLTPFSERARDRALHAVLISLCRHTIPELKENDSAGNILFHQDQVNEIIGEILDRCSAIDNSEFESCQIQLISVRDQWIILAKKPGRLYYEQRHRKNPGGEQSWYLMTKNFDESDSYFTLNSMRNVDVETNIYIEV